MTQPETKIARRLGGYSALIDWAEKARRTRDLLERIPREYSWMLEEQDGPAKLQRVRDAVDATDMREVESRGTWMLIQEYARIFLGGGS